MCNLGVTVLNLGEGLRRGEEILGEAGVLKRGVDRKPNELPLNEEVAPNLDDGAALGECEKFLWPGLKDLEECAGGENERPPPPRPDDLEAKFSTVSNIKTRKTESQIFLFLKANIIHLIS